MTENLRDAIERVYLDACVRLLNLNHNGDPGVIWRALTDAILEAYPTVVQEICEKHGVGGTS